MHTAIQLSVGGEHAGLQHVAERVDVQGPFGSVRLYYKTFSFLFYFESVPAGILPTWCFMMTFAYYNYHNVLGQCRIYTFLRPPLCATPPPFFLPMLITRSYRQEVEVRCEKKGTKKTAKTHFIVFSVWDESYRHSGPRRVEWVTKNYMFNKQPRITRRASCENGCF